MILYLLRPKKEEENLLFPNNKNCEKNIEQTHTKPQ